MVDYEKLAKRVTDAKTKIAICKKRKEDYDIECERLIGEFKKLGLDMETLDMEYITQYIKNLEKERERLMKKIEKEITNVEDRIANAESKKSK